MHLLHAIIQCMCSFMIVYQTLNPMSKTNNIINRMQIGEQKDFKAYSARTKMYKCPLPGMQTLFGRGPLFCEFILVASH